MISTDISNHTWDRQRARLDILPDKTNTQATTQTVLSISALLRKESSPVLNLTDTKNIESVDLEARQISQTRTEDYQTSDTR